MIDLILGQQVKVYNFSDLDQASVVNDSLGELPVVVWVEDDKYYAYFCQVDDYVLTFKVENCTEIDLDTATRWNIQRGLRLERSLIGEALQLVPRMSVFD